MGLSSLFTVAGLAVAIYAVLPRWRRLSAGFRIGPLAGLTVTFGALGLVHYYQLRRPLRDAGIDLSPYLIPSPFSTGELTYLTIAAAFLLLLIKLLLPVYCPHRIYSLRNLVEELRGAEVYSGLLAVIERNGTLILRIRTGTYPHWQLRSYLTTPKIWTYGGTTGNHWSENWWVPNWLYLIIVRFAKQLPTGTDYRATATAILRQTLLSRSVVEQLANKRPYAALGVLEWQFYEREEFLDLYFGALLGQSDSIIYHEVMESMTMGSGYHRFRIPESNRLLHSVLSNVNRAVELRIWKPVGDHLSRRLDRLYRQSGDPYNLAYDPEFDDQRMRSELYVGLLFFQIMVPEAMYQGVSHHMWLMYFEYFTRKMIRNFAPDDPMVDMDAEWPVRYNFLLYEMISAMRYWISTPIEDEDLDPTAPHLAVDPRERWGGGGNVPSQSITTIAKCLKEITVSEDQPGQFKSYIAKIVLGVYFDLYGKPGAENYTEALKVALGNGGSRLIEPGPRYRMILGQVLDELRYEKPHWDRDAIEALHEALAG